MREGLPSFASLASRSACRDRRRRSVIAAEGTADCPPTGSHGQTSQDQLPQPETPVCSAPYQRFRPVHQTHGLHRSPVVWWMEVFMVRRDKVRYTAYSFSIASAYYGLGSAWQPSGDGGNGRCHHTTGLAVLVLFTMVQMLKLALMGPPLPHPTELACGAYGTVRL